jgi:hypothetical protein
MKAYQTEEYYSQHSICPKCNSDIIKATTGPSFSEVINTNHARCESCGWQGIVHDLNPLLDGKELQDKVFGDIPLEKRLEIVQWVFQKVDEHMKEGGSYRFLIYERLGFGKEAYSIFYPYGMNISNAANNLKQETYLPL